LTANCEKEPDGRQPREESRIRLDRAAEPRRGTPVTSEESTAVRAARHQSLFREVNERVADLNETFSPLDPMGEWICECADERCFEPMSLTLAEYEAIREHAARFPVLPGHERPEVETVVEANDRYLVVEKIGAARAVAVEHDPRRSET
jgi:hypothetical protein